MSEYGFELQCISNLYFLFVHITEFYFLSWLRTYLIGLCVFLLTSSNFPWFILSRELDPSLLSQILNVYCRIRHIDTLICIRIPFWYEYPPCKMCKTIE